MGKNFFTRLEDSKYYLEDKRIKDKYALFNDKNYYKKYPTTFHLRKDLIEKKGIRLYFLAINQIMKRRGYFLFDEINSVHDEY